MNNQTRIERLQALRDLLTDLPNRDGVPRFDMGSWGSTNLGMGVEVNVCGTTACALGQAALDPWFRRRGLSMVLGVTRIRTAEELADAMNDGRNHDAEVVYRDADGEHEGEQAGRAFFGLTHGEAYRLFIPGSYTDGRGNTVRMVTRRHVIAELNRLIRDYERIERSTQRKDAGA